MKVVVTGSAHHGKAKGRMRARRAVPCRGKREQRNCYDPWEALKWRIARWVEGFKITERVKCEIK